MAKSILLHSLFCYGGRGIHFQQEMRYGLYDPHSVGAGNLQNHYTQSRIPTVLRANFQTWAIMKALLKNVLICHSHLYSMIMIKQHVQHVILRMNLSK